MKCLKFHCLKFNFLIFQTIINFFEVDILQQFNDAVANSKTLSSKPDNETLLQLYSLYKQATEGDNTGDAPSNPFDIVAKAKYTAWDALKSKTKEDAMTEYVGLVNKLRG